MIDKNLFNLITFILLLVILLHTALTYVVYTVNRKKNYNSYKN